MEPIVVFSAGVVYFEYRAALDAMDDERRERRAGIPGATTGGEPATGDEGGSLACVVGNEKLSRLLVARGRTYRYAREKEYGGGGWRCGRGST